jgi:two-component system, LuxR family, response regulator FixJ
MNREPTVFIVDDDPAFLESLAVLVLSMGLKTQVFSSGLDYLNQFDSQAPGILLLDVRMPNISGLAMQERLSKEPLCPPIIILTGHADVPTAIRALRQGAVEFFQKTLSESELREAIQKAIARDAENRREHAQQSAILTRLALLTPPERQVLELVISGYPNKTIASKLGVSRRAVEDRRARLMEKLEVDSLPELVRLATDAGLRPGE